MIKNFGAALTIVNSQFNANTSGDFYQSAGSVNITGTQFIGSPSSNFGVFATSSVAVTVMGSTFANHVLADMAVRASPLSQAGNASVGPGPHGIWRGSSILSSEIWNPGIVYVISSQFTIPVGVTLQIMPSTVVKVPYLASFSNPGSIRVFGTLTAQGLNTSPSTRVYFTSNYDDTIGGDTNGDGNATSPSPGDWNGIRFIAGSTGTIAHAVIRYASGVTGPAVTGGALWNGGGTVTVSNTRITASQVGYLYVGGTTNASQNSIHGNTGYITKIVAGSPVVNLANTWWGSATGPLHATLNPNGTGNQVSNNVTFSPWLTSDPN